MKKAIDNFSKQAHVYKKYRPVYPEELYTDILSLVKTRDQCWDCGTGNGQVAMQLSKHFKKVYATDISQKQIDNASRKNNIMYSLQRAEKTNFNENQFDLITVGQAVHWFDFQSFNKEVKRVAKNGATISIWGYDLLRISPSIDAHIDEFYENVVGPYWAPERKHINNHYRTIPFDFKEIKLTQQRSIQVDWNLEELEGYLGSWSSVQNYKDKKGGKNPVPELIDAIKTHWKDRSKKEVRFPIFMKMGRIEK